MDIKLSFLGAAQNVTGSRHMIEANGVKILVDCGFYQERQFKDRNWDSLKALYVLKEEVKKNATLKKIFEGLEDSAEIEAELKKSTAGKSFLNDVFEYAKEFGYKAIYTHEYVFPLYIEDQKPILEQIRSYLATGFDYHNVYNKCIAEQDRAIAYLRDGELWKIEGNPDDPLSNGRLCPRGTGGIGAHYSTDRIKSPLIRRNERGEEKWVEVTWDEALDYIATKMNKIKDKYGPESMAYFSHGVGGNFIKHTLKAYGTNNMTAPSFAQCRGPREVGFEMTFGEGVGSPERTDIENAQCITFIGAHLGENMHNTQVQELSHAIANNASLIVVDPRFSVVASKAKYYLPIKPGTDIALLLAWMNVIVKEKLYDIDYVEKYGFGFEQFAAEIEDKTPEWAYTITTIEPELIRKTAREMAKHKPASFIHPGRHATWYGDDTQRSRAIEKMDRSRG